MAAEKRDYELDGDILDAVVSRVPTSDLLQVVHVSRSWRRSALSSIHRRQHRPLLLLHLLNPRRPVGRSSAYDPCTGSWHLVPHVTPSPISRAPSFHSPPLQPLSATWPLLPPPLLHRRDPLAALIGPHLVLAGGTCDLDERTCEVESLSPTSSTWKICNPMPEILRDSASATWLVVAVSDRRMYVAKRSNAGGVDGRLSWYKPGADRWGEVRPVGLGGLAIKIHGIGMAPCSAVGEDRLFVVGSTEDGGVGDLGGGD